MLPEPFNSGLPRPPRLPVSLLLWTCGFPQRRGCVWATQLCCANRVCLWIGTLVHRAHYGHLQSPNDVKQRQVCARPCCQATLAPAPHGVIGCRRDARSNPLTALNLEWQHYKLNRPVDASNPSVVCFTFMHSCLHPHLTFEQDDMNCWESTLKKVALSATIFLHIGVWEQVSKVATLSHGSSLDIAFFES